MMPLSALQGGYGMRPPIADPRFQPVQGMPPVGTPAPYRPIASPIAQPGAPGAPGMAPQPVSAPHNNVAMPMNFGTPPAVSAPMSGPNPYGLAQPTNMPSRGGWNFFGQPNYSLGALGGRSF